MPRALLIALVFFQASLRPNAIALDPAAAAIDQAQALVRKKDRLGACAILNRAFADTPSFAKSNRARLAEALSQMSRIFFSDKGQRAFESGQSMMFENPEMALAQFHEALTNEDHNLALLENIAKIHLLRQECDLAGAEVTKGRALNPLAAEVALLELRLSSCPKPTSQLPSEKVRALPTLDKWQDSYVQYLQSEAALEGQAFKKALDLATRVTEAAPQFPAAYLVLGYASAGLGRDPEPALKRYIALCKAIGPRDRRRFSLEPRLCTHQKEVEDELAKKTPEV